MSASATTANCSTRNKHSVPPPPTSASHNEPHIDITKEEFARISEAFKKEEFRKLFLDYCEEIQSPENRKAYEAEIIQLEAERGVEVKFINPEPGFVVKTSVDGALKCFVNVAKSVVVAKPSNEACLNTETGTRGLNWSIPLAQGAPRDDLDAQGKRCRVYDVIFHPDALYLALRSEAFRKCLIDTALDAVEREFKVKLDRTNLKFPKLQFKGVARPTVIRKLAENPSAEAMEPHPLENIYPAKPDAQSGKPKVIPMKSHIPQQPEFNTPHYVIKHRHDVDLAEYTNELDAKLHLTVPRELVVEIELPLLSSTAECQLDVTTKTIYLVSERPGAKYRLRVDLPYEVNDKDGGARFDCDTRRLYITLPVIKQSASKQRDMHDMLMHLNREDSGVESEVNSNSESPVEELSDSVEETTSNTEKHKNDDGVDENCNEASQTVNTAEAISTSTSNAVDAAVDPETFLKNSISYQFPAKFDCNVLDNVMSLVLHVRNVQPESIALLQREDNVHLQFVSIGSGYYPAHYAFYLQLPQDAKELKINTAEAEAWENNVVLNLTLASCCEQLHSYLAGIDSKDLKEYNVQEKFSVVAQSKQSSLRNAAASHEHPESLEISVERSDCEQAVEIEIKPREAQQQSSCAANTTEDDEDALITRADGSQAAQKKLNKKQKRKNKKRRSYSESSCDDLKAYQEQHEQKHQQQSSPPPTSIVHSIDEVDEDSSSSEHSDIEGKAAANSSSSVAVPGGAGNAQQRNKQRSYSECRGDSFISSSTGSSTLPPSFKGILKRFSRYEPRPSISDSCSSFDEYSSYSCSADASVLNVLQFSKSFSDIPEENVDGLSESCKKTVRFNEVIKKQVFRLDSSILGQRKKNQKRRDRKQKALQRRLSEGDSADYEDNNKPVALPVSTQYFKLKGSNNNNNSKPTNTNGCKKSPQHDSGLDLSSLSMSDAIDFEKTNKMRVRLESESSSDVEASKNVMMFEMDM